MSELTETDRIMAAAATDPAPKTPAERIAEVAVELRDISARKRALLDEVRPMLLGKFCQRRAGDPTYIVTFVEMSPDGHLSLVGIRFKNGQRGNREFYIGSADAMYRIWSEP